MLRKVLVFSSKYCKPCAMLKEKLKETKIEFEEISIDEPEGRRIAIENKINAIPTVFLGSMRLEGFSEDNVRIIKEFWEKGIK